MIKDLMETMRDGQNKIPNLVSEDCLGGRETQLAKGKRPSRLARDLGLDQRSANTIAELRRKYGSAHPRQPAFVNHLRKIDLSFVTVATASSRAKLDHRDFFLLRNYVQWSHGSSQIYHHQRANGLLPLRVNIQT